MNMRNLAFKCVSGSTVVSDSVLVSGSIFALCKTDTWSRSWSVLFALFSSPCAVFTHPPPQKKKKKTQKNHTHTHKGKQIKRLRRGRSVKFEQNFSCFRYTSKKTSSGVSVYAIVLKWPGSGHFWLGSPQPTSQTSVTLLGYPQPIAWTEACLGGLQLTIPVIPADQIPCQWAWVFKLDNLFNAFWAVETSD